MRALALVLLVGCAQSDVVVCSNGDVCPAGSACDDAHGLCVLPAQLTACGGAADESACTVDGTAGVCKQDICLLPSCGDGIRVEPELCDGEDLGEANCTDFGFYNSKPARCSSACSFDTSQCSGFCGDRLLDERYEICDIDHPPTEFCTDYGYGAGVLGCDACGPGFDGCKTLVWEQVALPSPPFEIHGVADNDVYAALGSAGLFHFDGVAWTKVDLPCATTSDRFDDVWQVAPGVVFASGGDAVVRVAAGACTRWVPISGRNVEDVWAASADIAWAISAEDGILRFDGAAWTLNLARPGYVIWGSGPSDIYATNASSQVSHFNGASWSAAQTIPGMATVNSIWGTGPSDVYVGGDGASFGIVKHSTNGTVWTSMLENEPLLNNGAASSSIGSGVTIGGRTYVTAFRVIGTGGFSGLVLEHDGSGWANLDAPTFGSSFVWASTAGRVYAASGVTGVLRLDGSVHVSHGQEFPGLDGALAVAAPNNAYLAANGMLHHWDGRDWITSVAGPVDVVFDPAGNAFGVSDSGLYRSATGWTPIGSVRGTRISAPAVNDVWLLDDAGPQAWHWTPSTVQAFSYTSFRSMTDIWAASPTDVFIVGGGGEIQRKQGNGPWVTMTSGVTFDLQTIFGRSATDIYVAGQQTLLHFDGTTWSPLPIPPVNVIYSVWATALDDIFAGTEDGLWYFDGTQWTPVELGTPFRVSAVVGAGDSVFAHDFKGRPHQIIRTAAW